MVSSSRYVTSGNTSLDEVILDLERRVSALERLPNIGNTSIDTGELIVKGGDIIVEDEDGVEVMRITQNGIFGRPEIRFAPLGESTEHILSINGEDGIINGLLETIGNFEVVDVASQQRDGGFVDIFETGARVGIEQIGGNVAFMEVGLVSGVENTVRYVGRWSIFSGGTEALSALSTNIGAGFGGATIAYGATYATTAIPIVGLLNSAGALAWCITAQSTSSFTVSWTGTLAKVINHWIVRI